MSHQVISKGKKGLRTRLTALRDYSQVCNLRAVGNFLKALLTASSNLNKQLTSFIPLSNEDDGIYITRRCRVRAKKISPKHGDPHANPSKHPRSVLLSLVQTGAPLLCFTPDEQGEALWSKDLFLLTLQTIQNTLEYFEGFSPIPLLSDILASLSKTYSGFILKGLETFELPSNVFERLRRTASVISSLKAAPSPFAPEARLL